MNEQEALSRMVAPGTPRKGKYRDGVIQVLVTSQCDKSCFSCTQGSQLTNQCRTVMTPSQFEDSLQSLGFIVGMGGGPTVDIHTDSGMGIYWGVVGVFGGNPAISKYFNDYCYLLQEYVPRGQRGLWCNNPLGKGKIMRETFDPTVSNLNVHLDVKAYHDFKRDWPESMPFGLTNDSRHSPPFVAMKDVIEDESKRWELISNCDVNQHWSSLMGVFRGKLRAWFCELAGAQAMLHQHEEDYPDTGLTVTEGWWKKGMVDFKEQVRKHCHDCGIPLRGYGELSQSVEGREQVSKTHASIYKPKSKGRGVDVVTDLLQLDIGKVKNMTRYLQNAKV